MLRSIRIGNAQAFWGDSGDAAADMLAREPLLDCLTLDYLAEVSMSILARQRDQDPQAGFAKDFVDVVRSLAAYWSAGGRCRLIANAGGLNPHGCAEACRRALNEAGCRALRIGVVTGDDVLEHIRHAASDSLSTEFQNLDTAAAIQAVGDRLVTANAYLGAFPIAKALAEGADLVITGRVADPSLVVGACVHYFGWTEDDFDLLAGATVAGHLIECGTQVTGGISTQWLEMTEIARPGFPIVEVAHDGSCIVTKPINTGGQVTEWTVKEQLVYEIGDPNNYLSPDVSVSFSSLIVEQLAKDRVRVSRAIGRRKPEKYKVCATFRDGYRAAGCLTIVGRQAVEKARRCGELVLQEVRDAGFSLRDSLIECLGSGACTQGISDVKTAADQEDLSAFGETVLRVAAEAESKDALEYFSRAIMPLITAGPQGTTGYAAGRPTVHSLIRYWPCLVARDVVAPDVKILTTSDTSRAVPAVVGKNVPLRRESRQPLTPVVAATPKSNLRLFDVALARSGDKGIHANVGIVVCNLDAWEFLLKWLTAERVAAYFAPRGIESVERFELPNLKALNFVIRGILRQGLRTDAQGKTLGQILLEMKLPDDVSFQQREA